MSYKVDFYCGRYLDIVNVKRKNKIMTAYSFKLNSAFGTMFDVLVL